jgi:hypothetical protein
VESVSLDDANRGLDSEADSSGAEELPDEVDSNEVELDILSCESGRRRNKRKYRNSSNHESIFTSPSG